MQRERQQVTNKVLAYLNALPQCKAIKTYSDGHIERGTPDVLACYRGRMLAIECKVPGNGATKLQQYRLKEWSEAGAEAIVAHRVEDVHALIRMLDGERT